MKLFAAFAFIVACTAGPPARVQLLKHDHEETTICISRKFLIWIRTSDFSFHDYLRILLFKTNNFQDSSIFCSTRNSIAHCRCLILKFDCRELLRSGRKVSGCCDCSVN